MRVGESISVHSCKFDGRVKRKWDALLKRFEPPLIVLEGVFAEEVRHPILGTIAVGTQSTEFFWTDRWYSIFCFREPDGRFRNFYCNVNTPVSLEENVLSFVDLDVDILVSPEFTFQILDVDEFEENARLYDYPTLFHAKLREALDEIISLIDKRDFPFSEV